MSHMCTIYSCFECTDCTLFDSGWKESQPGLILFTLLKTSRFGICQNCHFVVNLKMPKLTIFDRNREDSKLSQIQIILPSQKSFYVEFLMEPIWCPCLNFNHLLIVESWTKVFPEKFRL